MDNTGSMLCRACGGVHLYGAQAARGLCESCAYTVDHPDSSLLTLDALDHRLDAAETDEERTALEEQLLGQKADWHGSVTTIVRLQDGRIGLELFLLCARCHAHPTTVYMTSGLHAGAWPYARDVTGTYLANLRDEEYVCDACSAS
jgi:hypothetical protein